MQIGKHQKEKKKKKENNKYIVDGNTRKYEVEMGDNFLILKVTLKSNI